MIAEIWFERVKVKFFSLYYFIYIIFQVKLLLKYLFLIYKIIGIISFYSFLFF